MGRLFVEVTSARRASKTSCGGTAKEKIRRERGQVVPVSGGERWTGQGLGMETTHLEFYLVGHDAPGRDVVTRPPAGLKVSRK